MVLLAVLCMSGVFGCDPGPSKGLGSFRGMNWGSTPREHGGLQVLAEEGGLKFYQREKDDPLFHGVKMQRIVYGFSKDRLYTVLLYFDSLDAFSTLKKKLESDLGPPSQGEEGARKYFWNLDPVAVLLSYDAAGPLGRVSIVYKPLQTELEVGEKSP